MESKRTRRIGNQIRQMLGELLLRDLRDPRIRAAGVVSITHVQVTPDLAQARVFLSATDDRSSVREAMVVGFRSAGRYLRGEVGRRLKLRRVPVLKFELDEALERANRLERVLKEVRPAEPESFKTSDDQTSGAPPGERDSTQ